MLKLATICTSILGMILLVGCGGDGFNRVPVSGTIAVDGLKDPDGYIVATPTGQAAGNPNASATIESGRFTFAPGQEPGVGEYFFEFHFLTSKVTTQSSDGENETGPTIAYRTKIQIPESGNQSMTIELTNRDRLQPDGGY
jgi:hypothetical protein